LLNRRIQGNNHIITVGIKEAFADFLDDNHNRGPGKRSVECLLKKVTDGIAVNPIFNREEHIPIFRISLGVILQPPAQRKHIRDFLRGNDPKVGPELF
jgi:hypothetical protein